MFNVDHLIKAENKKASFTKKMKEADYELTDLLIFF